MVTIFFMVQVVNNLAFAFNVAMTLHMIFRAVSIAALWPKPALLCVSFGWPLQAPALLPMAHFKLETTNDSKMRRHGT